MTAARGPQRRLDAEECFQWWFNAGERRTLAEVAAQFGVSYRTCQRMFNDDDWPGRADAIDHEAAQQANKRLASIIAKTRAAEIETTRAVIGKFIKRLNPRGPDGKPNPDYLPDREIGMREFNDAAKLFELLTGGATERFAGMGEGVDLAELEAQIIELEAEAAAAREGGNSGAGNGAGQAEAEHAPAD